MTASLVVLHEMKKRWPKEVSSYPTAIFAFYPSFSLAPTLFASYIITGTTPFLNPVSFAVYADSYTPSISCPSSDINANVTDKDSVRSGEEEDVDISKPLFPSDISRQELKERVLKRNKITQHPLCSPLLYEDMKSLKHVSLYLFACTKDPVLDHSVCMARKWKGPVSFDVMNNLQHGFLNLLGIDSNAKEASDLVVDRLRSFLRL